MDDPVAGDDGEPEVARCGEVSHVPPAVMCNHAAMKRRTAAAVVLGLASIACASGAIELTPEPPAITTEPPLAGASGAQITGLIVDSRTGDLIDGALVVLQCTCLEGIRESQSNRDGQYRFEDLPAGSYTVQVLYGRADSSRIFTLDRGLRARVHFRIDPKDVHIRT